MALRHRVKNREGQYDENVDHNGSPEAGQELGRLRFVRHLLWLGLCGALLIGVAGAINGQMMVENLLTCLVAPIGIIWLALTLMIYFCLMLRQFWPALIGCFCWLVMTVGGNAWVAGTLIRSIEAPYQNINPLELEPMDVVVVLGGGTNNRINGEPQLTFGGDRVRVAASLFHAGIADRLVCTGSQEFRNSPLDLHPREEATAILVSLGVPRESLLEMEGKNTSEEMESLRKCLAELADKENVGNQTDDTSSAVNQPKHLRVGIITSAFHMNRALRLARFNGLDVVPVPADFLSEPFIASPNWVVPSVRYLDFTSLFIKEKLARIVGR